jgi:hypothetical protein
VVSAISQIWGQMGAEEKQPYEEQYKSDIEAYDREMAYFYSRHPEERPKSMVKAERAQQRAEAK